MSCSTFPVARVLRSQPTASLTSIALPSSNQWPRTISNQRWRVLSPFIGIETTSSGLAFVVDELPQLPSRFTIAPRTRVALAGAYQFARDFSSPSYLLPSARDWASNPPHRWNPSPRRWIATQKNKWITKLERTVICSPYLSLSLSLTSRNQPSRFKRKKLIAPSSSDPSREQPSQEEGIVKIHPLIRSPSQLKYPPREKASLISIPFSVLINIHIYTLIN